MPVTDAYTRLPLSAIYVDRDGRQRRSVNTKGLLESIRLRGVLQPVIIDRDQRADGRYRLVVGERRYTASLELGLPDIPIRWADDLTPLEAQIFELEENIKRQDLDWQDIVRATERIHNLYRQLHPHWTQDDTAEATGLTKGPLSLYLSVAAEIDTNERVANASTVNEAYNMLKRRASRLEADTLDAILGFDPPLKEEMVKALPTPSGNALAPGAGEAGMLIANPAGSILLESFLHWAPKYTGRPFNFIHCDFPYGISVFAGPRTGRDRHDGQYSDHLDVHFQLLSCLLVNLDKLASSSCHIMYWFSMRHYALIQQMVAELAPSLSIHVHPLIWVKSDNDGMAPNPKRDPRHVYETALLLSRGDRMTVRTMADAYSAPTDKSLHIHTKPEPMLRHFFSMLVDDHTSLLDPTCGSGAALRAAESLGARSVLGMDIDDQTVGTARTALRHARVLRGATQKVAP